jgi:hypothetical protein
MKSTVLFRLYLNIGGHSEHILTSSFSNQLSTTLSKDSQMRFHQSQLKRYVPSPTIYAKPKPEYDVANKKSPIGSKLKFETVQQSIREDYHRAASAGKLKSSKGTQLSTELLTGAVSGHILKSSTSFRYFRMIRQRLIGQVIEILHQNYLPNDVGCVTIVNKDWEKKLTGISNFSPKTLKVLLRKDLRTSGLLKGGGFIFFCLHASFDGTSIQLHYHGIIVGKSSAVLKKLHSLKQFKSTSAVKRPIQIKKLSGPDHLVSAAKFLAYATRLYWTYEPWIDGEVGKKTQIKTGQRIPEPAHAQMLLRFAKASPLDFIFMNGVRFVKSGNQLTLKMSQG